MILIFSDIHKQTSRLVRTTDTQASSAKLAKGAPTTAHALVTDELFYKNGSFIAPLPSFSEMIRLSDFMEECDRNSNEDDEDSFPQKAVSINKLFSNSSYSVKQFFSAASLDGQHVHALRG